MNLAADASSSAQTVICLTMQPVSWTMWPSHQVHNGCKNLLMNEGASVPSIMWLMWISTISWLYFGQPMHAFDLDTSTISVCVCAGEKLVTLTGKSRELEQVTFVITVADKPVALAGGRWSARNLWKPSRVVLGSSCSSMANRSVRLAASTFVLNLLPRLKKHHVATVNEALDAAASMIAELLQAQQYVRHCFSRWAWHFLM